jgi:succinate-acetate transporter protein
MLTSSGGFSKLLSGGAADQSNALAWFLVAFAVFNTYMLLWATQVNLAVTGVFLTLEITEILLAIGCFRVANGHDAYWVHVGGWAGIVTAGVAWYTSAAGVVNSMSPRPVLPVGRPLLGALPPVSRPESPLPRRQAA